MSNLEHLMENALVEQQNVLERTKEWEEAREDFLTADYNIDMAKIENVPLTAVWQMAYYVTYTWREAKLIDEIFPWD